MYSQADCSSKREAQCFPWGGESPSVVSKPLQPHGLCSPWNCPGENTGVRSLSLHQGIFAIQGSNPGLPHCSCILYQLSHKGSPLGGGWGGVGGGYFYTFLQVTEHLLENI